MYDNTRFGVCVHHAIIMWSNNNNFKTIAIASQFIVNGFQNRSVYC